MQQNYNYSQKISAAKLMQVSPVEVAAVVTPSEVNSISKRFMQGYASFYGENDGFNGRRMANGTIFNSNDKHVAAHPTLPLGTKLKVTDLSNDKVLYVEVTDRMPVHKGRVIDLSRGGAKYLGMHDKGLQKVELVKISDDEYISCVGKSA